MYGMNKTTGESLSGIDHLRQSIVDILTTPIGSCVMRPSYGSRLYELVDAPMNIQTIIDVYAATAEALIKWEPRFTLNRVQIEKASVGEIVIFLEGEYKPTQQLITLGNIIL